MADPDCKWLPNTQDAASDRMQALVHPWLITAVVLTLCCSAPATAGSMPPKIETAVERAGTNSTEISKAWDAVPEPEREGMAFLLENMPERDLRTLSAALLLENTHLAYVGWNSAPWREKVPKEIFLNEILPYASLTERRENWRPKLREIALPLITNCVTPAEAAQRLNQTIFKLLKVRYSTDRKRADQCPSESMESGIATCSGLSVLLVDACRAVGVPARVAGTPLWINERGNHTWVEIWDGGWHFTGAAEPDPKGLDRGWFVHDASQAKKDVPRHAIYATSFRKSGLAFPLVWAKDVTYVSAENVTDRYTAKATPASAGNTALLVKVLDRPAGKRVSTRVSIVDEKTGARLDGTSKDESADLNDMLRFEVPVARSYRVRVDEGARSIVKSVRTGTNGQEVLVLALSDKPALSPSMACYVRPPVTKPLQKTEEGDLKKALKDFFNASAEEQQNWKFAPAFEKLLRENEPAVRATAWDAYKSAAIHNEEKDDFEAKQVRFDKYLSKYTVRPVGTRPTNGWPLFIAMHGGGGAPKEVNDSQWRVMQRYYKDHPELGGYLYLALRAPNDTWNGFYDVYVYPLVANLIREFVLFGDVDPNKVFIMGYSHGGYGAFAIGPKMPDRFAAIHSSAAAPTDGETTGKTLRNTIFTYMVGEKDTAYGRIERDRKFNESIKVLRGEDTNSYPVIMEEIAGNGHTGLPDRDKIKEMYPNVRNPVPTHLTWLMTDKVVKDFYWLQVNRPTKKQEIDALCSDNRVTVTTSTNVSALTVLLDRRLVDLDKPITIEVNGNVQNEEVRPSLRVLCDTLQRRGDPDLAFTAAIALPISSGPVEEVGSKFPCPEDKIVSYTAYRINEPIQIDGRLEESAWQHAPRSPRYIDLITGRRAIHDTKAAILWDDTNLYIAVQAEEPFVHAKFTTNNSPIYYDNDIEVFIAGRDAYYEFEVNAFNTTYEAFFIWEDAYEAFSRVAGLERANLKPFNGVGFTSHPRGKRLGSFDWTFPGKQTAVFVDGTINKDEDRDRGWTVEMAFPWKGMELLAKADGRSLPPKDGDEWRLDFSRFNQYKEAPPAKDSGGWALSRHGIWDSHIPECFPRIRFSTKPVPGG